MLSFGLSEVILTLVVIIVFVGPKDIPILLKRLGILSKSLKKIVRDFKKLISSLAEESDIQDIKNSFSEIKSLKDDFNINENLDSEINLIKETVTFTDKEMSEINDKILKD